MNYNLIGKAVPADSTDTITTLAVGAYMSVGMEIKNSGAAALDAFELWGQFSDTGATLKLAYQATDFTGPVYPVVKASGSPLTLASGATAWVVVNVEGLTTLVVKASATVSPTTLDIHATVK